MKTFIYNGRKYEAIGNILGGFVKKSQAVYCAGYKSYNNETANIDYKDFYKVAKKAHASCDVYKINGSNELYMLCGGGEKGTFCRIIDGTKIKKCSDYERWYK